ncbi:MAG: cytidylate kinase family protein [Chloroflexi bacterium]|nr:cytidylate kinase family protein [Chloroflexota bacterium]
MSTKNIVLTVSRERGSGGREIAQEVARQLNLPFVDSQIIQQATQQLNIPAEELAEFDEKVLPQLDKLSRFITKSAQEKEQGLSLSEVLSPDRDAYGLPLEHHRVATITEINPDEQHRAAIQKGYHELVEAIIKDIASKSGGVILGRGANFILGPRPNAIYIHVQAPLELRIQRLITKEKISRQEAEKEIEKKDKERADYIRHYYQADWRDPSHYALVINTEGVDLGDAVAKVVELARIVADQKPADGAHKTYDLLDQESYTLKEAASLLWISTDSLLQAAYRGELKVQRIDHKVNRISRQALVEYLHRST